MGPFLPTKVAPIFGPRHVAKVVRSTAALWGDGGPHTPSSRRLAPCDLPKIDSNVAYADFSTALRRSMALLLTIGGCLLITPWSCVGPGCLPCRIQCRIVLHWPSLTTSKLQSGRNPAG